MGIIFEQVNYSYGNSHQEGPLGLRDVSLSLTPGRFIAVLGASGSGKSTLLQHFNGILLPQSGSVRILDYQLEPGDSGKGMSGLRKRVGLVFQFPEQQLFEDTVEKDICFGPLNFGVPLAEAKAAAQRAVLSLGLDAAILARNPFQLSGGQMRKVAIATVLAADPDVLVLDEPTATLDQASRQELLELLHALCKEQGKTIILVTHRLEEALPFAEEYVVMHQAEAIFHGSPAELLSRTDLLSAAGMDIPPSVRFVQKFSARYGMDYPNGPIDINQLADYIVSIHRAAAVQE
ncbi:MAG: energy-coupling factor transporter ATPase [Gorillibacterium sp.]|nr:energy-coupling factor transporter ATPase [Gorillibacterium sp.]